MNKQGWGLRVELVIIILFLICLLISTIGLNKIGLLGENDNSLLEKEPYNYNKLEQELENAAKRYVKEFYNNNLEENKVIIKYTTLYNNGYVKKLKDKNYKECSGYVEAVKNSSLILYFPYIKCKEYTTNGYERRNDW